MTRPPRLHSARYTLVTLAAVVAIAVGVARPVLADDTAQLSATDRIKAHPPPPLFSDTQVATMAEPIANQALPARSTMAGWWASHGSVRDDSEFISWVERTVPPPPPAAARERQLQEVRRLKATRTLAGVAAATWLEANGKKDIWKLYQHDQRELLDRPTGKADKKDLKLILSMAKTASDAVAARDQQSAPYVLDPSLRSDKVVRTKAVCPCSYPSRHAARSAAARAYLGFLAPHRLSEYTWMEEQVTYSRLYMAGHVQSDIDAGTRLGDMIAEYVLVTRGYTSAPVNG
ncbi:MAG: hypothetical protein ABIN55_14360 [Aeromicrobium sp.]